MSADKNPKLRWAYMDHWRVETPQGAQSPYTSVRQLDVFMKQLSALGFEAIETFGFTLFMLKDLFGSLDKARTFMQERGIEKVLSLFLPVQYKDNQGQPTLRATHDYMFDISRNTVSGCAELGVENLIAMPAGYWFDLQPMTDDKLKAAADCWSRIGRMTLEEYGVKVCTHHEFFCGIRSEEEVLKFYEYSDPRYVYWYCDTAQHVICSVDPVALYNKLHDRCGGFHLKDTHHVDLVGDHKKRPESEVTSTTTPRWFWEMGTEKGLVDFPALFEAMKQHGYEGWVSVEHDKADLGGSNYQESTAISAWYIQNVLEKIYA